MKFIIQNMSDRAYTNDSYLVIDTTSCTSQNSITTLAEAITTPLPNTMSNLRFRGVEDESAILQAMKIYPAWQFIQFVYDESQPYEFW